VSSTRVICSGSASSHLMQVRMNILSFYNCQRRPYGYIINDDAHVCISPVSTSNSGPCMVSVCSYVNVKKCFITNNTKKS